MGLVWSRWSHGSVFSDGVVHVSRILKFKSLRANFHEEKTPRVSKDFDFFSDRAIHFGAAQLQRYRFLRLMNRFSIGWTFFLMPST